MLISPVLYGQKILDNYASTRVEYKFSYKKDSTVKGYYSDILYLDICESGQSFFYSRARYYRDSIMRVLLGEGLGQYDILEKIRPLPRGVSWHLRKEFVNNKYAYGNYMITRVFSAESLLEIPRWELQNDMLMLNGHVCKKASGYAAGRLWHVWYAPDIPINDGPWLLWGLPGLIVRAEDANGYFKFECSDFGQLAEKYPIFLSSDHVITITMTLPQLLKAEIMFEETPDDFIATYLGGRRMGDERLVRKYIPLISPTILKNKGNK